MKYPFIFSLLLGSTLLAMALSQGCAARKPVQAETPVVIKPYFPPEPDAVTPTQGDGNIMDPTGDCPSLKSDRLREELLFELNQLRSEGGECMGEIMAAAPALQWDPILAQSAAQHAQEMALKAELTALGADGSEVYQRLSLAGWSGGEVGENLNHGARSIKKVLQAWQLGSAYCQNIYNPRFTKVGAGYVDCYWYVIFGE